VAVRWFQHSPMFGHCADSQTVCNPSPRASLLRLWKFSPTGALALSHSGFACRTGRARSIWTNWEAPAICSFDFTWIPFHHGDTEAQRTP